MKVERMQHTETPWRLQVEEYCLMGCDGLQSDRYTSLTFRGPCIVIRVYSYNKANEIH